MIRGTHRKILNVCGIVSLGIILLVSGGVLIASAQGKGRALGKANRGNPFVQLGEKVFEFESDSADERRGPVRRPIVNPETVNTLDLTPEQDAQIASIVESIAEQYPDYESALVEIKGLENQADVLAESVEGFGRIRNEYGKAVATLLTEAQLDKLLQRPAEAKGGPPLHAKRNIVSHRLISFSLDRLDLTADQLSEIEEIERQFESENPGVIEVLAGVRELKQQMRKLEKSVEEANDRYAESVSAILSAEQLDALPKTGPKSTPPRASDGEDEDEEG